MLPNIVAPSCFSQLLRQHMGARRWSQERLGAASALDHSLVCRLLSGQRSPTREAIGKLATGLALTTEEKDRLLIAADYFPEQPEAAIGDEPELLGLYRLLRAEGVSDARKADMRAMVRSLVRIANQEG